MNALNTSNNFINALEKDFKAEVIAAELVETGIPADRILILMLGALKRSYSKDVESVDEELSAYDHKEFHVVKTPKEGFYDKLPQGLFHKPATQRASKTEQEIIKSIKERRIEEKNARKFFLPFETGINHLRLQMAVYENHLDLRSHYSELVSIFSGQWELFRWLDTRQSDVFLYLIPFLHEIRDDHKAIEIVLELFFQLPVTIDLRPQLITHPEMPVFSRLGDTNLGTEMTTGNAVFAEGEDELYIHIGPVGNERLKNFMPGGKEYKILHQLYDYMLPVHLNVVTEVELKKQDRCMRLAEGSKEWNTVLGSDTFL